MLISYKWIQEFLKDKLPEPEKLDQILNTRAFEVEGIEEKADASGEKNFMIDIDVLPNRAHDCLCHYGIAKEIGMLTSNPFIYTEAPEASADFETNLKITIDDENCLRYVGCEISNISVKESPLEIREKLEAIGQRSINTIVDISNIVMFELGQPMHAFDRKKISGDVINIRKAKEAEEITLLDGNEIKLNPQFLLITDAESPLAIAGIKGGKKAEVDAATTSIVFESANFNSGTTRKTGQKLGIKTESSKRFEHEITPELSLKAMHRAIELVKKYASIDETKISNVIDIYPKKAGQVTVAVSVDDANKLLGSKLSDTDIEQIFQQFKFEFEKTSGANSEKYLVKIPAERLDLRIKEDLIEEIGRVYGYENIEEQPITSVDRKPEINKEYYYVNQIRVALADLGFSEVMTQTFEAEGSIRVLKPLAEDRAYLRTSLVPALNEAADRNLKNADLLGSEQVKIFEIGKVFENSSEKLMLGLAVLNNKIKKPKSYETVNEALQKIKEILGVEFEKKCTESESVVEINLGDLLSTISSPEASVMYPKFPVVQNERFETFSNYPFVLRDIAVWIPGSRGKENDLVALIKKEAGNLLVRHTLFDIYEKIEENKTSYAVRLVFQSMEKTLTDEEINRVMEKITGAIFEAGWEAR